MSNSALPEYDVIPSIRTSPGIYSLDRWPANVEKQIAFLEAVKERWGPCAAVFFAEPYDGYPGYIKVTVPIGISNSPGFARTACSATTI